MRSAITLALGFALLFLATSGAALGVAAVHALIEPGDAAIPDEFGRRVRAGRCKALRSYTGWWLACAGAWLLIYLVLQLA